MISSMIEVFILALLILIPPDNPGEEGRLTGAGTSEASSPRLHQQA